MVLKIDSLIWDNLEKFLDMVFMNLHWSIWFKKQLQYMCHFSMTMTFKSFSLFNQNNIFIVTNSFVYLTGFNCDAFDLYLFYIYMLPYSLI